MKALVYFLLAMAVSVSAYAKTDLTVIYDKSTGELISVGYSRPDTLSPNHEAETVTPVPRIDRLDFYKRTGPGVITEKTQEEKEAILEAEKPKEDSDFLTEYNQLGSDKEKLDFLARTVAKLSGGVSVKERK